MKPLNPRRLKGYIAEHVHAEAALRTWWTVVQSASWKDFTAVRQTFNSASYTDPYVVFNIKGNDYRLVTYIDFDRGFVVLKWFGTHAEYSRGKWK
ncbi:MAG: type II toxin-antitoxin system HigB family toxin [Chloroflexota bacterium]